MLMLILAAVVPACTKTNTNEPSAVAGVTSLQVTDVRVGTGTEATNGRTVVVHYTGWLYSATAPGQRGTQFDSSVSRGQPFSFVLGAGSVIRGWDQGVLGMRVGGQRVLVIPPSLGYGASGAGGGVIPPNASLVFEIDLLEVR
jgi:FKBP-type peptidyl-prolyl cis-trans isomerase FkpA